MHRSTAAGAVLLVATLGCPGGNEDPTAEAPSEKSVPEDNTGSQLHVEVFYRERMLLPPTATLEVVLEDSAKMDVAAELVTRESVALEGASPPFRLTLEYDPAKLHGRGRYGVRARIENEGQLMFTSTQFHPAFGTHGSIEAPANDPVQVLVRRVSGATKTNTTSITGTRWAFKKLRGEDAGTGAGGKAPFFTLQGAEPRISGFAGCNQIARSPRCLPKPGATRSQVTCFDCATKAAPSWPSSKRSRALALSSQDSLPFSAAKERSRTGIVPSPI
jgi:putative lipoprotein